MRDDELRQLFQALGEPVADAAEPPAPASIRWRGRRHRRRMVFTTSMALLAVTAASVGVVQARSLNRVAPGNPNPSASGSTIAPATTLPSVSTAPQTTTHAAITTTTLPLGAVGELHGVQFVSPTQGWAVGKGVILATSDGGRHWGRQYGGDADLQAVDFVSSRNGWALGTGTLLGTGDGGQHWRSLAEPAGGKLVKVHFHTPQHGYGIAAKDGSPATTWLVATDTGGATWHRVSGPPGAGTPVWDVCFTQDRDGWLVAGDSVWHDASPGSGSGAAVWSRVYQLNSGGDFVSGATLQCAGTGAVWVQFVGGGAAGHEAYALIVIRNGGAFSKPAVVNQFTWGRLFPGVADGPGSFPGPFSAISPTAAFVLGSTPAANGDLLSGMLASNPPIGPARKIPSLSLLQSPQGVSFVGTTTGWVVGADSKGRGVILITTDGGRSWRAQLK